MFPTIAGFSDGRGVLWITESSAAVLGNNASVYKIWIRSDSAFHETKNRSLGRRVEVTGEEFVQLVKSKDLRSRLAEAGRITMRTGHESGFRTYRDVAENIDTYTPALEGETNRIEIETWQRWAESNLRDPFIYKGTYILFGLHFHPRYLEPLRLSLNDIRNLDGPQGDLKPIVATATVDCHGKGDMLLLQKTFTGFVEDPANALQEELYSKTKQFDEIWKEDPAEFARSIEVPGFVQANTIPFRISSHNSPARIHNADLLRRFSYSYPATGW